MFPTKHAWTQVWHFLHFSWSTFIESPFNRTILSVTVSGKNFPELNTVQQQWQQKQMASSFPRSLTPQIKLSIFTRPIIGVNPAAIQFFMCWTASSFDRWLAILGSISLDPSPSCKHPKWTGYFSQVLSSLQVHFLMTTLWEDRLIKSSTIRSGRYRF